MAFQCKPSGRRGMTISVVTLGAVLCAVMIAYIAFGDSNDEQGLRTLRMISIVFRHGDKTPSQLYPRDPHIHHEWPGGLGALSQKGVLQTYNLGKNLRMRYYRLLPQNGLYSKDEMFVLSSYAERCLMSAQSMLAGFVPPLENQRVLPIQWQPIAINSIPREQDRLLAQKKPCLKYDTILKKMYTNPPPDLKRLNEENKDLYEYLTRHTGKNITSVLEVELLYGTFEVERDNGLELPAWTKGIFPEKMIVPTEKSYALFTETALMKKVKGGAFVTEVLNNMLNKQRKTLKPDRKIFLYSAHDITLVNIMNSLGVLDQTSKKPDYAAALVFELHHSFIYKSDLEVKLVYYYNSDDKFPKEINIPNCDYPCSLTKFRESVKDLIIENFDEICENVPAVNVTCNQ